MYSYIKGVVTEVYYNAIVIENSNIGYFIHAVNPYSFVIGNEYKIYIYTHVKEDEYTLYGFKDASEKELFLLLIEVKGLGPKMALSLMSGDVLEIKTAIKTENINYLKKFPKVGEKLAKQIILDLKKKINVLEPVNLNNKNELTNALINLGYKESDIKNIVKEIEDNLPLDKQIKKALQLLLK